MTLSDLNEILFAAHENRDAKVPYQLHDKLRKIINALGGTSAALAFFEEVERAEPADFSKKEKKEIENEHKRN